MDPDTFPPFTNARVILLLTDQVDFHLFSSLGVCNQKMKQPRTSKDSGQEALVAAAVSTYYNCILLWSLGLA